MSGGSHNYIYSTIEEELVGRMHDREIDDLMQDIADLAHDLEWADSGDYSPERYKKSVEKFKLIYSRCAESIKKREQGSTKRRFAKARWKNEPRTGRSLAQRG